MTDTNAQPRTPRTGRPISRIVCAALCVLALLTLSACGGDDGDARATNQPAEEPTVKVEELGEGEQDAALKLNLKGPLQVNYRRVTIPPGEGTGEHCHHGNLIAVVEAGTLTHRAPIYPGGVHEYEQGDSIFEGSGYVHEGTNEGDEDVVLLVTYITPEGDPLAETDLGKCDQEQ